MCGVVIAPAGAKAANLRLLQTPLERVIEEAKAARLRAELDLADELLAQAAALAEEDDARILWEQGLVQRERGDVEAAAVALRRSAALDPSNGARLDLCALLVVSGRWPEAVVELDRVFVERGASLRADDVLTDLRFARLLDFEPYKELIRRVREEQQGPIGKLQSRLEGIEASARKLQRTIDRLSD